MLWESISGNRFEVLQLWDNYFTEILWGTTLRSSFVEPLLGAILGSTTSFLEQFCRIIILKNSSFGEQFSVAILGRSFREQFCRIFLGSRFGE